MRPDRAKSGAKVGPLCETIALPYNGHGTVAVLDDGTLIITVGGEERIDPTNGDVTVTGSEAIAYQLDTSTLRLVEHEGEVVRLRDRHQGLRGAADFVVGAILQAQLQTGDIAAAQRRLQRLGKGRRLDPGRCDQVEAAAVPGLRQIAQAAYSIAAL